MKPLIILALLLLVAAYVKWLLQLFLEQHPDERAGTWRDGEPDFV